MKRFLSGLFWPALILSLGWSLRGQFGHLKGAMIPGALTVLAWSLAVKEPVWKKTRSLCLILSSLGFSLGGTIGYGGTIERILQSNDPAVILGSLGSIFLMGALWGGLGLSLFGFGLSERPFDGRDLLFLGTIGVVLLSPLMMQGWEGSEAGLLGASFISVHLYNWKLKKSRSVAWLGWGGAAGFGLGFLLSVLLLYAGEKGILGGPFRWWTLRDQFWGAFGGLTVGLLATKLRSQELFPFTAEGSFFVSFLSFLLYRGWVPFVNGLNVFIYWSLRYHLLPEWMVACYLGVAVVVGGFVMAHAVLERRKGKPPFWDFEDDHVFFAGTSFVLVILTIFALAKETLVFGLHRWELGFTVIAAEALVVLGLLVKRLFFRGAKDRINGL